MDDSGCVGALCESLFRNQVIVCHKPWCFPCLGKWRSELLVVFSFFFFFLLLLEASVALSLRNLEVEQRNGLRLR